MIIDENSDFFAINVGDSEGFPAIEFDITNGFSVILIFSSIENAKHFLYLRNPELIKNIFQLNKVVYGNKIIQAGLLRIARLACKHKNVKYFVFDSPGCVGEAQYVTPHAILNIGRRIKDKQEGRSTNQNELFSFLENQ